MLLVWFGLATGVVGCSHSDLKPAGSFAECDKVVETHKRFVTCSKLTDDARKQGESDFHQVKVNFDVLASHKGDTEDPQFMNFMINTCKQRNVSLEKALAAAGC